MPSGVAGDPGRRVSGGHDHRHSDHLRVSDAAARGDRSDHHGRLPVGARCRARTPARARYSQGLRLCKEGTAISKWRRRNGREGAGERDGRLFARTRRDGRSRQNRIPGCMSTSVDQDFGVDDELLGSAKRVPFSPDWTSIEAARSQLRQTHHRFLGRVS